MISTLFKKHVHVKPAQDDRWIVEQLTPAQSFLDDWRRYGLRVAWHNLKWILSDSA